MVVKDLEVALLERFPRESAEPWDKVGMSVGRPGDEVSGVAVALDPSPVAVRAAYAAGCNVLVCHHPAFISAPELLTPVASESSWAGEALYAAAELGVSVISLHTNLDRSMQARRLLPGMIGLAAESSLEFPDEPERLGLGALCRVDEPLSLGELARRCAGAFGGAPRVWGSPTLLVRSAAVLGGSLGEFGEAAASEGADVVIAGEAGYHVCLDVLQRGCSLILLGHDRSEMPFCGILAEALAEVGVSRDMVDVLDVSCPWWTLTEGEMAS